MNKKGFTLIELLAVIVILAVIALIATPVIMNAISNAKQGAWKDAAYGIIKATENVYAKNFSEVADQVDTFFLYENGVMTSYPSGKSIDYKGSVPQDGGIVLHADGSITLAIHDGSNCAVKTKSASTVTVSTTDKATCISNIYYKQASAPFNNLVTNGNFSNGFTGWVSSLVTGLTVSNNEATYKPTAIWGQIFTSTFSVALGNKYYVSAYLSGDSNTYLQASFLNNYSTFTGGNVYKKLSYVGSSTINGTGKIDFVTNSPTTWNTTKVKDVIVINLTSAYSTGSEPTKAQMDDNVNKVWIDSATNTPKRFTTGGWINF